MGTFVTSRTGNYVERHFLLFILFSAV